MVASLILAAPAARAEPGGAEQIAAAVRLYGEGRTIAARATLEQVAAGPGSRDPSVKVAALGTLLDICFRTRAAACAAQYVQPYLDAANAAPAANEVLRRETIRQADYYLSYGRFLLGSPQVLSGILDGEAWRHENASNVPLYLQRQALAADILLALDRPVEAVGRIDRTLSLVASLKNPEVDRCAVAQALSDAIGHLIEAGDTERALGVYRASHVFIAKALPPASLDAALFRLTQARVLEQTGDVAGAAAAADAALAILQAMELEPDARDSFLVRARAAGLALAMPQGPARREAILAAAGRLKTSAERPSGVFGGWMRPGALEQTLISAALSEAGAPSANPGTSFALFQLAGRAGPSFDADALTALGQARSTLERRSIHQALRLKARRDRSEREAIQAVTARALSTPPSGGPLTHDSSARLLLRAFNDQVGLATRTLHASGVAVSGANLTPLRRFQALLKPNEAALAVAPVPGGLAYMCVRRDGVFNTRAAADLAKARLDTRLLQLALTATHAPDDSLDAQFPTGPATRLYDVYIRPFEPCLKGGDQILWLSSVATLNLPLAALLERTPPAVGKGYDLAAADWLVKRYSVSYPGSAAMIVATRAGVGRAPAAFDFLGVGDPVLKASAANPSRRSADLAALAPLPETGDELRDSARGFRAARVLVQDAATEAGFRRELVGSYRYLSFATHGLMRDEVDALAEPALVFTAGAPGDPTDDGLLTASEIADLNLQARFVALSACNTANFDLSQVAQDLPALASAFAVAGAPATLATLWPLNSEAGKRVVPGIFVGLRDAAAPAEALALAQRRFLTDPPSPAYRHPRFWAPFVVLGDGGAGPADAGQGASIASVEAVTGRGGEVIALTRSADSVSARFIGDADARGRHTSGVRLARADGVETWRTESDRIGATRFLATLGGRPLAGGYALTPEGRFAPTLTLHDPQTGAPIKAWRGDGISRRDAVLLDGAWFEDGRAVFVVGEPAMRGASAGVPAQLHLLTVDETLQPARLVDIDLPPGLSVGDATVRPRGRDLLLTYTDRNAPHADPPPATEDDYDQPLCFNEPTTWVELRDARTGALKASAELKGYVVSAADGGLLGGSRKTACEAESRGVVFALDAQLRPRAIYADETLGLSEVRALKALPGGRMLVVANKQNVLDYRDTGGGQDAYAMTDLQRSSSGLVLVLARDGRASPPTMVDTGRNVFLSAAETDGPGRVVVGGSVGGGAALVRLSEGGR